jgi:hypothetical protein
MFIRALLTTLLVLVSAADSLRAGTRDPNTPDQKYLEFGKQFPWVARFRAVTEITDKKTGEKRPTFQYGSAVIIRPNWALTAAHLVHNATDHTILRDDGTEHALPAAIIPKEYDSENIGYYDLALCYSPTDFKLKFYTPLYAEQDEVGKAITIAGYGITGTFHTGCALSDGKKRAGHNKIDSHERAVLICSPSSGMTRLPLEFMIAPGDSGGGMFIGNALAGINSFVMAADKNPDSTYGDESAFTRISLYINWIESQIEQYERALAARATMNGTLDFQILAVDLPSEHE